MSIFDDICADAKAGTPGNWSVHQSRTTDDVGIIGDGGCLAECFSEIRKQHERAAREQAANARRIARVPELERIALAAEELMDFAAGAFSEAYSLTKHIEGADKVYERRKTALTKLREASK